jgi:hypothetical protein
VDDDIEAAGSGLVFVVGYGEGNLIATWLGEGKCADGIRRFFPIPEVPGDFF